MKILSHKKLNLHSASSNGRLINFDSRQVKDVPDDVTDHPAFQLLVNDGSIVILPEEKSADESNDSDENDSDENDSDEKDSDEEESDEEE